jgi:hypothetical protein
MTDSLPDTLRPAGSHLSEIKGYLPAPDASDSNGKAEDPEPKTVDELIENARRQGPVVVFEHIEVLARASESTYQAARETLKEETGINLNGLASARRDAIKRLSEQRKSQKRRELEEQEVPFIQVDGNRPTREVVDEATTALETQNDPPQIFRRGDEIVRVDHGGPEDSRPAFESVGKAGFDDLLSRSANFAKETEDGFEHADLPKRLVKRVRGRAEFPRLKSVSQVPVLRPDGSVFRGPGYDEKTKILCCPGPGDSVPKVPETPTGAQQQRARELLEEPFRDFPFVDQASRANLFAALLTPILRPLLGGANVPLFIFDATKQGTGKTLLTDVVGLISTGQAPPKMSAPDRESEWRKQITAQLRKGQPIVAVDNVKGRISSSALERALTSKTFGDRLLGQSRQLELPADVLWIVTGNNLRPQGEMTRRCALVRMDAGTVRPWERSGFEYPNLRKCVQSNRGALVAAGLTLVRAWINDGRPTPSGSSLGSFERWADVVGGVLRNAGIDGFLENLDEFYETAGQDESRWSCLLEAIHRWTQGKEEQSHGGASQEASQNRGGQSPATFTANELAEDLQTAGNPTGENPSGDELRAIRDALPDALQSRLRSGEPIARGLGKCLGNRKGTQFPGGWHVRREGRSRKGTRWAVCQDEVLGKDSVSSGTFSKSGSSHDASSHDASSHDASSHDAFSKNGSSSDGSSGGASPAETSPENAPSGDRPPAPGEGSETKPKASGAQAR